MMWSRHLLIVAASLVLLSACAEEREPIDRVQPNVVRKADLEGEWFYQQTVIDMDTSANYAVIGDNAFWNLERIRWDVQENYLYARRSFEWVDNSDTTDYELDVSEGRAVGATVTMDGRPYMGAVVAAFRIESHFDIRREYNPTTGEEINVIVENDTDRPWSEREYMRVDWSMNLSTDYDFDYFYYNMGELEFEPIPYYVQENGPAEHQPTWDYDENDQLWYFDFVQQLAVHPASIYYDYYDTNVPTCWFFVNQGVDCASTTLTVRASFLRTNDEQEDYEVLEHKGPITSVFGIWTVDRTRYLRREGYREQSRRRYAQRHNIWERSHTGQFCQADTDCYDPETGTGTPASSCDTNMRFEPAVCTIPWTQTHFDEPAECTPEGETPTEAAPHCTLPGSYCQASLDGSMRQCTIPDVAQYSSQTCEVDAECPADTVCLNGGECTIPYYQRTPKPILFYTIGGWPDDLDEGGMWDRIETDWDWAFRRAAVAAQLNSQITDALARNDEAAIATARERLDNIEVECTSDAECQDLWGDFGTGDSVCQADWAPDAPHPFAGHCTTPIRQLYYICHSPVRPDDPTECGPTGRVVRMGDIRYNTLVYSREWNPLSPLGQSPTAPDPFTGRIFGSTVCLYDAVDGVAERYWEWGSLLNGQMDPADFIDGENLSHWVAEREVEEAEAREETVSRDELREMYRARNHEWMNKLRLPASEGRPVGPIQEVLPRILDQLRASGAFDGDRDSGRSFLESLHGTPVEEMMVNDEVLVANDFAPDTPVTDEVADQVSFLSPENEAWRRFRDEWRLDHDRHRNVTYADLYWVPYEGLANQIAGMTHEEAFQYIRRRLWEGLIIHELGHNMGINHNFAGSEDSLNFPVEWWAARTNNFTENPANRLEDPVDDTEIAAGIDNLAYSSVMDYTANYAAYERLGRYDRAHLLYSYGGAFEAYREVEGGVSRAALEGYWSWSGSWINFTETGMEALHYTELYRRGGMDLIEPENRMILPAEGLQDDMMNIVDPADPEAVAYTRVPYLFCNEYQADLGENCHLWDYGVDTYERMQDLLQREPLYYLTYNFRRGRINSDPEGFLGSIRERLYDRFKWMHDIYVLYDAICHQYYSDQSCEDFFTDTRTGWGTYTAAINDAFNFLTQTIARPGIPWEGWYSDVTRGDGLEVWAEGFMYDPTLGPRIGLIDGRYFTTAWNEPDGYDDCGTNFWECLHTYGFYLNKILAIILLGEAETFFVARDTAEDIRMWRISYFDDYPDQINDLFGGILSEDFADFAPYLAQLPADHGDDEYSELFLRNYAVPEADPVNRGEVDTTCFDEDGCARPVDPNAGFTVQLYAAALGFGMFHTNFDNSFITSSRLCICGGDHCVDPGDGADPDMPVIRFEDPETGMAYCAINREDGLGIAQRMVVHANDLKARTDYCDGSDPGAPDACVTGLSNEQQAVAEREMMMYRDQLDIVVRLTSQYDNWYFSYGNPFDPGSVPEDW